jgi:hypothetical protein
MLSQLQTAPFISAPCKTVSEVAALNSSSAQPADGSTFVCHLTSMIPKTQGKKCIDDSTEKPQET